MRFARQTRPVPLIAIGVAAALFLFITYQYSEYTLAQIDRADVNNIESSTQVQVTDTASVLVAKLQGVASSVQLVANTASGGTTTSILALLGGAEASAAGFVDNFFWIADNGTLLALDNGTVQSVASYAGTNLTGRPYFSEAEASSGVHITGALPSLTNASVSYIFVSEMVQEIGPNGTRVSQGVVGAAIELTTLGSYIQSQISLSSNGDINLLDANATILYTQDAKLVGQNIFSQSVQSGMPSTFAASLDTLIRNSLNGASGVSNIDVGGTNTTVAYVPVYLDGVNMAGSLHIFGILYMVQPDTLEGESAALLSQLRVLSSFVILGIAGVAVGSAVVFLGWNKRLDDTVTKRTSDLVAANEQLRAYARSQTDFVNIAAHELRTPTQSILGFTEILQDVSGAKQTKNPASATSLDDTEMKQAVDSISSNARRLKKLTDDILTVSRIDDNRMVLTKETFDLNNTIKDVITETETASGPGMGVAIKYDQTESSIPINADNTKIHEVLSNLLNNAARFSGGKGTITVRAGKTSDNQVMVSIKDQGKGIDPEVLPRLFNKFVTTSPSGTGLGLFIASKLVVAHGGRMWAQNNGPDEPGSTFSFTLPMGNGGGASPSKNPK